MSAAPSVTVVLPVHNGADYLKSAIESVLAQDYQDFQLHVLDDASGDDSAQIAQDTGDARVRYSRNPGRFGLFKTLNRGFEEASSPLVRIWAHDDLMVPGSLSRFVDFATRHPSAGLIYSDFIGIDSSGHRTGYEGLFAEQRSRTPDLASPTLSALLFWLYGCLPGNISTTMVRRDAWRLAGGFLTGIQQAPDFDMWVRLSEASPVGFIRERLVELRAHAGQLGRVGQKQMTTVEEELPVYSRLRARLAGVLTESEFRHSWVVERGRQHVHWAARAAIRGDFATALRGWRAISAYGYPFSQLAFWLFSGNGRLFRPNRQRLFDAAVKRLGD